MYFCFILLFTSSSPCRKDQFDVSYFSSLSIWRSLGIRAEGVLKDSGTVCLVRLFFPLPSLQEPNASCSLPAFYDGLVKFLNIKGFL